MKPIKIYQLVLSGSKNVAFSDFIKLLESFGFNLERISGSHHIFKHPLLLELINIQNVKGKVKPYQIKQFLSLVETYNLNMENK